jgi:hypothetical protein
MEGGGGTTIDMIRGSGVTKHGVTERGVYGCVCCVNVRFADQGFKVNPAVYFINENGGFYLFGRRLVLVVHGIIVVTYEICVFFEGAQKEVFSSILSRHQLNNI